MNINGGFALIRSTWASWLQHRGFFFLLAFLWMIPILTSLFIWIAAASDHSIQGLSQEEFIAYYLILALVNQLTYSQSNWTLGDTIRYGSFSGWLLRPIAPLFNLISTEVAGKVVYMTFSLPIVGLLSLILHPRLHTSYPQIGIFIVSVLLAWGLRFFWGFWMAELAFWSTRADSLLVVQDSLVFLLAGVIAPVFMLPEALSEITIYLPFWYMVGFPVEILVRGMPNSQLLQCMAIQTAWLGAAILSSWLFWKNGLKRYSAVGG